jgi:hypothetical protein
VRTKYRREKLSELFRDKPKPTLEDVLEIFATPLPQFFQKKSHSTYYLQMVAEVTLAADERSKRIVREFHDPIARDMIDAFRRVLPALTQEKAVWAYLFAVGARRQAHAQNGRAQRLGSTVRDSPHALLIPFLANAISAMATGADKSTAKRPVKVSA